MFVMNFKKKFAPAVESGEKRQTIRALRKDGKRPQIGEHLRHYTGMRTNACRRLIDAPCTTVALVQIFDDVTGTAVVVAGRKLSADEVGALATADGFATRSAFVGFFREEYGLPFEGLLIGWDPLQRINSERTSQ